MTTERKHRGWDWVSARHKLRPQAVFDRLRTAANSNVERRSALRIELSDRGPIRLVEGSESSFTVQRNLAPGTWYEVTFELKGNVVTISEPTLAIQFDAEIVLTHDGEEGWLVDGELLDDWQILRKGLEQLFFDLR